MLALMSFVSRVLWSVTPPPDGGYAYQNTAEGLDALFRLTSGADNTAIGFETLSYNSTGSGNTAIGADALLANNGANNTAVGAFALENNITGIYNTATGYAALNQNHADNNTADGFQALYSNDSGSQNTAIGMGALSSNTTGSNNTALGVNALSKNTTGTNNLAVGTNAGSAVTSGSNNIDLGNLGARGESGHIRIGAAGSQTATFIAGINGVGITGVPVEVSNRGQLGVKPSSARFKEAIKPMGRASEAIFAFKPVTFRYNKEVDQDKTPQFGLVAEDVEKIAPELVVHDEQGKPFTVRYEPVNAMLLNEFLKEHRKVEEQQATITELKSKLARQDAAIAQQERINEAVALRLKGQDAKIQRVNDKVEFAKPARQTVDNNR
ncbi:MAG: tail fiber domain-containing protein [Verrucomicrobia bacterium]|nr:tail fiber domain-containing protein [Verrucomicrobiota bacterium]